MKFIFFLKFDKQDCWLQGLSELFGNRIISRNSWPPPALDLSPQDFCLRKFLKKREYRKGPHTSEELNQNSEVCFSSVTAETLHYVAWKTKKKSLHA
jgi:hypothetical protein